MLRNTVLEIYTKVFMGKIYNIRNLFQKDLVGEESRYDVRNIDVI